MIVTLGGLGFVLSGAREVYQRNMERKRLMIEQSRQEQQ